MSKVVVFSRGSLFIKPFNIAADEVLSPGGVWIKGLHKGVKPIFGRVTHLHPECRDVRIDDWVIFLPQRPQRIPWSGGVVYHIAERELLGVLEPGDGRPWFTEERKRTERTVLA